MKKISYFLFLLTIFVVTANNVSAYEYSCTYYGVEIDPTVFSGKLGILYGNATYDYGESGVTYNGVEKINIKLTLNTDSYDFEYTVYANSSNSQYFVNLINSASYNYSSDDPGIADIYDYYKSYKKYRSYTFANSITSDATTVLNVTYYNTSADGTCPIIASGTTFGGKINGIWNFSWGFGDESNSTYPDKTYSAIPVISSTNDEILNEETEDAAYKTCSAIDLGDGYGSHEYYIIEKDDVYYYSFYNTHQLLIIDSNIECLDEDSFDYCPWKTTYNKEATVVYSGDCQSYYNDNLDYADPDYFDYNGEHSESTDTEEDTNVLFGTIDCESDGFLGSPTNPGDTAYYLQLALEIMRYIAIVALIALSSVDYAKAVSSGDADALKKANKTVIKRLIYTVLLFIFPIILKVVFNITGIYGTVDPFCGLS